MAAGGRVGQTPSSALVSVTGGGGRRKQGLEDVTSQKAPDMDTWVRLLDQECLSRVRSLTHTLSPEASHL